MLDEVASAGRENLDAMHISRYDAKEDAGAIDEAAFLKERHPVGLGGGSGGAGQRSRLRAGRSCWLR
jgi:hypothetical protein